MFGRGVIVPVEPTTIRSKIQEVGTEIAVRSVKRLTISTSNPDPL